MKYTPDASQPSRAGCYTLIIKSRGQADRKIFVLAPSMGAALYKAQEQLDDHESAIPSS